MKIFKKNFGFTMIELIMVMGLLGAVTIGTGLYLSDSFKDSNELSNKAQVQASVGALMNKFETVIKVADVPVFLDNSKPEFKDDDDIIINYLSEDDKIKQAQFKWDAGKVLFSEKESGEPVFEEKNIYELIESIRVKPVKDSNDNSIGAEITIVGEGNKYSLTSTYYSRNTLTKANAENNKIYYVRTYNFKGDPHQVKSFKENELENGYLDLNKLDEPTLDGNEFLGWKFENDDMEFKKNESDYKAELYDEGRINEFKPIGSKNMANYKGTAVLIYNPNTTDTVKNMPDLIHDVNLFDGKTTHEFTIVDNIPTRDGYVFLGWNEDKDATDGIYKKGNTITVGNSTKTLYAIWRKPLLADLDIEIGDYVKYIPSSSSYTVPTTVSGYDRGQEFDPSATTLWKVFSIDGNNIEIISADSVGDLALTGSTGYINLVQTLQDLAVAYINPDFVERARSLGYSEKSLSKEAITNYRVMDVKNYPLKYGINSDVFPYYDNQPMDDRKVLADNNLYENDKYLWLAHRDADTEIDNYSSFLVSGTNASTFYHQVICLVLSGGRVDTHTRSYGFRPIVTLKSDIEVISGDGETEESAYVIMEEPASQYTITYCANEGYGEMEPQVVAEGSSITLDTNTYERHDGYEFVGWSTNPDPNDSTIEYEDGDTFKPKEDITLYAKWEEKQKYTLTYLAKAPEGSVVNILDTEYIIDSNQKIEVPQEVIEGENFTLASGLRSKSSQSAELVGWTENTGTWISYDSSSLYDSDGKVAAKFYQKGSTIKLTENKNLYAVWKITISYDGNTGTYSDGEVVKSFDRYTTQIAPYRELKSVDLPSRDNYILKGWARDKNTIDPEYGYGQWFYPSFDTTFYAVWESKDAIYDDTILAVGDALNKANIGVFVKYVPTSTKFEMSTDEAGSYGNHNPSNTQLWRVFKVNNDGTVELISADSATDVIIRGKMGYKNLAKLLSGLADAYVNTAYAISARPTGYAYKLTGDNLDAYLNMDESKYPIEYNSSTSWSFPYFDSYSHPDQTVFENNPVLKVFDRIIMPTREAVTTAPTDKELGYTTFFHRILYSSNNMYGARLYQEYSDGTYSYGSQTCGFRPIVTLIANLPITGGSGSYNDPYILGTCQHQWANPEVSKLNCIVTTKYTCTICGEKTTQTRAADPNIRDEHDFSSTSWAGKNAAQHFKLCKCEKVEFDHQNHKFDQITEVNSLKEYTCTICGYSYSEVIKKLVDVAEVGDYVTYVPSSTSYTVPTTVSGYTSNQTYEPSNTTSWRVFSKDETNIEIISAESVGELTLQGRAGYINAVQTLQDMAAAYVNSNYAISARSLGYRESGLTSTQLATYKVINITTYPLSYGVSGFPYQESYCADDLYTLYVNEMDYSNVDIWLASRTTFNPSNNINFSLTCMRTDGVGSFPGYLYGVYSDGSSYSGLRTNGVRPIIALKPTLKVSGGDGTEDSPYVVTESAEQYTITYCANGGYGDMLPQSVAQGSSINLTTNTYEHHSKKFLGWSTDATATSATYTNGQTIVPTADITLYAIWNECEHELESQTTTNKCTTITVYTCNKCDYVETEEKIEHIFTAQWRNDGEIYHCRDCDCGSTKESEPHEWTEVSKTTTTIIYECKTCGGAKQEELNTVTITYDANGGTGAPAPQTEEKGARANLSSTKPTRSGYTFNGWSDIKDNEGVAKFTSGTEYTFVKDETLYAAWESTALTQYTITYDANAAKGGSGTVPAPQTIAKGTASIYLRNVEDGIPTPPNGMAFRGWSTDPNATVAQYKPGAYIEQITTMTLYAVYVEKLQPGDLLTGVDVGAWVTYEPPTTSYTVSSNLSGTSSSQKYIPGNYKTWRVFSNEGSKVEIVVDENVGTLTVDKNTGFVNYVQMLQDISAVFVNSKYAVSARHFGYNEEGLDEEQVVNYNTIDITQYPLNYGSSGFPYIDYQCNDDVIQVNNNGSLRTAEKTTWLASRETKTSSLDKRTNFNAKYFARYDGIVYLYPLTRTTSSGEVKNDIGGRANGVRPIVQLRTGLKVASGDGSPTNPYVLEAPEQITLTYATSRASDTAYISEKGDYMSSTDKLAITETVPAPQYGNGTFTVAGSATRIGPNGEARFVGWSKTKGTWSTKPAELIEPNTDLTVTEDTTLYAVWEIEVSIDANGGTFKDDPDTKDKDESKSTKLSYFKYSTGVAPNRGLYFSDIAPEREGYVLKGWTTNEDVTKLEKSDPDYGEKLKKIDPEYGDDEWFYPWHDTHFYAVWEDKTTTYAIAGEYLTDAEIGAYVEYVPTSTSVDLFTLTGWSGNGTVNPSETKLWRVFRKVNGTVELVSADKSVDIALRGENVYKNLVNMLCNIAEYYKNDNFTTGTRPFGYRYTLNPATQQETINKYKVVSGNLIYGLTGFPYNDDYEYYGDAVTVRDNPVLKIWDRVVLPSRNVYTANGVSEYGFMSLHTSSHVYHVNLYKIAQGVEVGKGSNAGATYSFRPIVTLKEGVKVTGGDGSYNNPYKITLE